MDMQKAYRVTNIVKQVSELDSLLDSICNESIEGRGQVSLKSNHNWVLVNVESDIEIDLKSAEVEALISNIKRRKKVLIDEIEEL